MTVVSNVNHIAISVADAEKAIEWYTAVLGLRVLIPLRTVNVKKELSEVVTKIYGEELEELRTAILTSSNGIGFEIFEFVKPRYSGPETRPPFGPDLYTKGGFFHMGLTVSDLEETVSLAEKHGGKKVGEMVHPVQGEGAVYIQDPWGNIIELMSCGFEQMFFKVVTSGVFS